MALGTYVPIVTQTLASASGAQISLSSFSGYTDLILVWSDYKMFFIVFLYRETPLSQFFLFKGPFGPSKTRPGPSPAQARPGPPYFWPARPGPSPLDPVAILAG